MGWALIAGPVLFMLGAALWDPRLFQGELDAVIHNIATRRGRWAWIHAWMTVGLVATTCGIAVWLSAQASWPVTATSWITMLLFLFGTAAFLAGMAVRHGVDGAAADAVSAGDPLPAGLRLWQAFLGTIHSLYIYLANAAAIALGVSAMLSDSRLTVIGWVGIVAGVAFAVGYRLRPAYFAPPFIPTVYPAVLGIAVLVAL